MLVVLCGPSGVGKTSVIRRLHDVYSWRVVSSYTTRRQRSLEEERKQVGWQQFVDWQEADKFFAVQEVMGNFYGQLREDVQHVVEVQDTLWLIDLAFAEIKPYKALASCLVVVSPKDEMQLHQQLESADRLDRLSASIAEYREVYRPLSKRQKCDGLKIIAVVNRLGQLDETVTTLYRDISISVRR